jgi:hypothetical protein
MGVRSGHKLHWGKPRKIKAAGSIVDPYFEWASATNFVYYGKHEWLPILLELDGLTVGEFSANKVVRTLRSKNVFHLSPLLEGDEISKSGSFCTAFVKPGFVSSLLRDAAFRNMIRRFELSRGMGLSPRGDGG